MYDINFDKNAKDFLKKLKRGDQEFILKRIELLKENPHLGKRLAGNLFGLWKLRIDKFRVLYRIFENKLLIVIIDIGHRKNIYE
ncbi:type II toxin-antitoxin system RelE/ParE family toxin [Candidatus Pacearchaeota archaeon]|nr:type II toxin-antitoxin system RelE/ParE family toxin [Candidatus Pacearchaeota archaeon]